MSKRGNGDDSPQIYVAALGAYNAGSLHGDWIDATQDPEEIRAEIQEILRTSPEPGEEEWAIHDYDGFGELKLGEFESIETVSEVAKLIKEHGPVFSALISHVGGIRHLDEALRFMNEGYQGEYDSAADWAEQFAEDTGAPIETYRQYIDWERVAHDAELGSDIFVVQVDGRAHVFSANV